MACSFCSNDILSLNIHIVCFFNNSRNTISKLHQSQFHRSKPLKYVVLSTKKKKKIQNKKYLNTETGAGLQDGGSYCPSG